MKISLKEVVLVLGDSHCEVFLHPALSSAFSEYKFNVIAVGGATVSGLQNPNSVTQALPKFQDALRTTKAHSIIFMLGEGDTGFVIWYRAQKYGLPVDTMYEQALSNYQKLLRNVSKYFHVVCISTPLPSIVDDNTWGEIANLRREVRATQQERTALTLRFNRDMQVFCEQSAIPYMMLDGLSLGKNGLLMDSMRHPDPTNHHYDPIKHAAIIEAPLRAMLASRSMWRSSLPGRLWGYLLRRTVQIVCL